MAASIILVAVAVAFAWSMGAHYTGACMGMPYASHSISLWPALGAMAILALIGATFASHKVEQTVGHNILPAVVTKGTAIVIVLAAFVLTTIYTKLKIPTSTIQILVFCVVGAGLAIGSKIDWTTIWHLAVIWVCAPVVAVGLGFLFTHLFDHFSPATKLNTSGKGFWPVALVVVGAAASFVMGSNDVSNATGAFLMTHLFDVLLAGLIGGIGLSIGVLTWGKPLLQRVAFDIVKMDLAMASAAQLVQALVVISAVAFGYFTSMNQALIGAMAGTGLARGRETVQWPTLYGILKGWAIGPASGLVLAYVIARVAGSFVHL
ncbi:MAG TPA: inorganic phosphate transporter [Thermomicrobiaceae bacterium]|nr:inorganic phosphate transporter [Thermomicrobiaceae bacterium]